MDLNAIISELQKIFNTVFGDGVVLQTRLDPDLDLVNGDRRQVESILVALLMQARDVNQSEKELCLTTSNLEVDAAAAGRLSLAPGRYARLDLRMSHRIETEVVHEAVTQLHGAITTSQAPGRGVTISLTLPQVA
jgi:hypothetical protein